MGHPIEIPEGVIQNFKLVRESTQTTYHRGVRESNYPRGQCRYWPGGRVTRLRSFGAERKIFIDDGTVDSL